MKHLRPREAAAIIYYRNHMKLSISHISKIVERSTRTIHKVISKNSYIHRLFDKRHMVNIIRIRRHSTFLRNFGILTWFYSIWIDGLINDIRLLDGRTAKGERPP